MSDTDVVRGGLATPPLIQPAQIAAVYSVQRGAILAAALTAGATTITVDDADAFVDEGGALALETAEEVFTAANPTDGTPAFTDRPQTPGVRYTKVDRVNNVLTLAVPWDATFPSFAAGDSVWVDPPSVDRRADVCLDGDPGQVVSARIPYSLQTAIPEGLRIEGQGEWIEVEHTALGEGYEVRDVHGEPPVFDPTGELEQGVSDAQFDYLAAAEIESPSVAKRNPSNLTLYVSPTDPVASDDNGGEAISPLIDTFTRTNATAWGTSDSGHAWTTRQNQGNILDTDGANARYRLNGGSQNDSVSNAFGGLDVELLTTIGLSGAIPSAGSATFGVTARMVDGNNFVGGGLTFNGGATASLDVVLYERIAGGNLATLATSAGFQTGITNATLTANDYRIRFQAQSNPEGGTDLRVKVWLASGTEPDLWTLEVNTLSTAVQSPNSVGTMVRSGASYATATTFPIFSYRDYTAQMIGGDGLPVDLTLGGIGPLATINAALEQIGEVNDGNVTILLAGEVEEDVFLTGLTGGGQLTIDGAGSAVLNGYFRVQGAAHYILLRSLTFQDTGSPGPSGTIHVQNSTFVHVLSCQMQANGYRSSNVWFQYGAQGRVEDTQLNGATTRAVYAANGSLVYCKDNRGGGAGVAYNATCAIVFQDGTKPTDGNNTALGGQIFQTTAPTNSGGTAPPTRTKKTDTITANGTKTWRPAWGWKSGDETIQGEYAGSGGLSRGCAFYGQKTRKAGKTADSGKVFMRRIAGYGGSGKSDVYLAVHDKESATGTPAILLGPTRVGALAWGEGAWFNVPKSYVQSLMTGGGRGLMVYHGSASPYLAMAGRGNGQQNWQLKITYH